MRFVNRYSGLERVEDSVSRDVCDRRVPVRVKGKLCQTVRPAVVQGQDAALEPAHTMAAFTTDEDQHGGCFGDRGYQTDLGRCC